MSKIGDFVRYVRYGLLKPKGINYHSYAFFQGRNCELTLDSSSVLDFEGRFTLNNGVILNAIESSRIRIADNVYVGDYTIIRSVSGTINIGRNTLIAQGVKIIASNHNFEDKNKLIIHQGMNNDKKNIEIGEDVWLGASSVILPGIKIGSGAVVAAGAIVTKDVPENAVVVGNPARIIKYRQ